MVFNGLVAYPITPFHADGAVNFPELRRHIAELAVSGVDAITVLGSSGSFAYLDRQERADVVRHAVEAAAEADADLPVTAGVSAVGTREILQHAADAAAAGARGLVLSAVSYIPLSVDEVAAQTRTVAAATELPICLYNNPDTTRFEFPLELVAELAQLPNVTAFKDAAAGPDIFALRCRALKDLVPDGFSYGLSGDLRIAEDEFAADAWHSGPAALLPQPYLRLRRAVLSGVKADIEAAKEELLPVLRALADLRKLSGLHSLARACGIDAGDPRLPLLPIPGSEQRDLARLVDDLEAETGAA
jgi:4-hydroxy-tetrahydrodipicolinate synthase